MSPCLVSQSLSASSSAGAPQIALGATNEQWQQSACLESRLWIEKTVEAFYWKPPGFRTVSGNQFVIKPAVFGFSLVFQRVRSHRSPLQAGYLHLSVYRVRRRTITDLQRKRREMIIFRFFSAETIQGRARLLKDRQLIKVRLKNPFDLDRSKETGCISLESTSSLLLREKHPTCTCA